MRNLIKDAMGLEANIAHQKSDQLFKDITAVCTQLKGAVGDPSRQNDIVKQLNTVIKRHTGLNTKWEVNGSPSPNAWVMLPVVQINHPLMRHFKDYAITFPTNEVKSFLKDVVKETPFYAKSTHGHIDLINSRVHGVFEEVVFECALTQGHIEKDFTAEEIASTVLHETGHAFTYLIWLSKTAATNVMIEAAWNDFHRNTNTDIKLQIVDDISGKLNVEVDRESLANTRSKEFFTTVLLSSDLRKNASDVIGNTHYSYRNVEQLADQFASRHGATRALASTQYKFTKFYDKTALRSKGVHYAIEGVKAALFLLSVPLTWGASLLFIGTILADTSIMHFTYDDAKQRMKKIQDEVIVRLKDPKLSKKVRDQLTEEYRFIKAMTDQMSEQQTLLTWVIRNITGWRRDQQKQAAFQLELERLLNNELFYQSQRLRNLS